MQPLTAGIYRKLCDRAGLSWLQLQCETPADTASTLLQFVRTRNHDVLCEALARSRQWCDPWMQRRLKHNGAIACLPSVT